MNDASGTAPLLHVSDFYAGLQGDGGSFWVGQPDDLAALVALQPSVQGLLEAGAWAQAVWAPAQRRPTACCRSEGRGGSPPWQGCRLS